ncbi:hypothetical protein AY599_06560 [Leptolyngbya valderiana BDU 20041]|nr:type II toxin-antitoxin system HicB family antitoxin [Geitlerinema sp. CS-897]OAB60288.1 hypothetical protein AY599_06560 [Leptolyngbya valderiana BDU 20041]
MSQYSTLVQRLEDDRLFLGTIPELADRVVMPCTHGKTRQEAIHHAEEVIEMYLVAWKQEGLPIPEPMKSNLFQNVR